MLSKEQAENFSKITKAPSVIKDTMPEDGFGSTALASINTMIKAAGDNTFTSTSPTGTASDRTRSPTGQSFLNGDLDAAEPA